MIMEAACYQRFELRKNGSKMEESATVYPEKCLLMWLDSFVLRKLCYTTILFKFW